MKKYDSLVVGSGLYGAVFAHEARKAGKSVLVIDKRPNIAGNVYTEEIEKIHVHKYGAHIFHTNNKKVWNYITQFAEFNRFTNSPVANYKGELYSLPFNMYTFNKMWGVVTPDEAKAKIEEQKKEIVIDVRQICRNLPTLIRQIEIKKKSIENAERTYEINLEKYRNGNLTGMDLQQFQNQLTTAKQDYTSAIISYKIELLNLKIQTLWDFETHKSYLPVDLLK